MLDCSLVLRNVLNCPNRVGDSCEKMNRSKIKKTQSSAKSVGLSSACTGTRCIDIVCRFCILVLFWSSVVYCLLFLLFYVIRALVHPEETRVGGSRRT